jgi:hypothetical protein
MSAALFDEPIKAWANGKIVLWLGVSGPILDRATLVGDTGGYALVNHTDGKAEWIPTKDIQTDWRYDDTKGRWFDASLAVTPDAGDEGDDSE